MKHRHCYLEIISPKHFIILKLYHSQCVYFAVYEKPNPAFDKEEEHKYDVIMDGDVSRSLVIYQSGSWGTEKVLAEGGGGAQQVLG